MIIGRSVISIVFLLCFCSPTVIQAQSNLTADELWQYGRGVIYDFYWHKGDLRFSAGHRMWQVDPLASQSLTDHSIDFFPLSISPDGQHVITQDSGEFRLRDAHTGDTVATIKPGAYREVDAVAWRPDSQIFATVGYDEQLSLTSPYQVNLWTTDTGEHITSFGRYADLVVALSWHPTQDMLAVRQSNGTITIENPVSGKRIQDLMASPINMATLAWSPNGRYLAATSDTQTPIPLWRTDTFEPITVKNVPGFVVSLAWNNDSTRLAGAFVNSGVGVWNIETGTLTTFGVEPDEAGDHLVERVEWHGNLLAALDRTQRLRVWDVDTGTLIWDSTEHEFHNQLWAFAASTDGTQIALSEITSRVISILDGQTGELRQTLYSPRSLYRTTDIEWSASGKQLAVSTGDLFIWSLKSDRSRPNPIEVDSVNNISWSPDGVLAVSSIKNGEETLQLINGETGALLDTPEELYLSFPLWSPDGRYVALYRYNPPPDAYDESNPFAQIALWDWQQDMTTILMFPLEERPGPKLAPGPNLVWLPDGSGLMGYTKGGALWRWTVGTPEADIIVQGPDEDTSNQAFFLSINANGRLLAVSNPTTDGQIHILDAKTGEFLLALPDLVGGWRLFAWGGDQMLFVYDGILHAYRIR